MASGAGAGESERRALRSDERRGVGAEGDSVSAHSCQVRLLSSSEAKVRDLSLHQAHVGPGFCALFTGLCFGLRSVIQPSSAYYM